MNHKLLSERQKYNIRKPHSWLTDYMLAAIVRMYEKYDMDQPVNVLVIPLTLFSFTTIREIMFQKAN